MFCNFRRLSLAGAAGITTLFAVYALARLTLPVVLRWIDWLGSFSLGRDLIDQIRTLGALGFGLTAGGFVVRLVWRWSAPSPQPPDPPGGQLDGRPELRPAGEPAHGRAVDAVPHGAPVRVERLYH